jgi:uncharacterized membrane protein YbaN (DUF454 family)
MNNSAEITKDPSNTGQLPVKRLVYRFAGHLLFGAGAIGIVLPVMPTTIFWIGAAACYLKSSPENYNAIIANKRYGTTILNYIEHGVIDKSHKKVAVLGMLISLMVLLIIPIENTTKILSVLGLAIAAAYVLTRPGQVSSGLAPLEVKCTETSIEQR